MMPISITKSDLLAKLLRTPTEGYTSEKQSPLFKRFAQTAGTSDYNRQTDQLLSTQQKSNATTASKKTFKTLPVAEFVDIQEETQKFRERLSRKRAARRVTLPSRNGDEELPSEERRPTNSCLDEISSSEREEVGSSCRQDFDINDQKTDHVSDVLKCVGPPENDELVHSERIMENNGKNRGVDHDLNSSSKCVHDAGECATEDRIWIRYGSEKTEVGKAKEVRTGAETKTSTETKKDTEKQMLKDRKTGTETGTEWEMTSEKVKEIGKEMRNETKTKTKTKT